MNPPTLEKPETVFPTRNGGAEEVSRRFANQIYAHCRSTNASSMNISAA